MKRIFIALFLACTFCTIHAQNICDSTIYINPIQDICITPDQQILITASHVGGVFSGPNISAVGWINVGNMLPGTYQATYTITTDSCELSTTENFIILDQPSAFAFSNGTIDCTAPGSSTVELIGSYTGNGFAYWVDDDDIIAFDQIATVDKGGIYTFVVDGDPNFSCPTFIPVQVNQVGEEDVDIIPCGDCSGIGPLLIGVDFDTNVPRRWKNLTNGHIFNSSPCVWPQEGGVWQVKVRDPVSGCISSATEYIPSSEEYVPSISAGATSPIPCAGSMGQLLGAYNETEWDFDILWTTNDGNLVSDINTLTPYFNAPGTYYLTVTNPFNGCFDFDSVTVAEAPITNFLADTICAGEFSWGYDSSGTYIDTFPSFLGCDSIRILDLLVNDSIQLTASTIDDDGTGNGAIILALEGEAPFSFEWSTGVMGSDPFLPNLNQGSYDVTITSNNGCFIIHPFIIGLDPLTGGATAELNGLVFFDENNNCLLDPGEQSLSGVHVRVENQQIYAQNSNEVGAYIFPLSIGDYYLTATPPSPIWASCMDSILVSLPNDFDTLTVNYPMQALVNSPILDVEIATTGLRRCFENTITIHYQNNGTATATDAFVEVLFDNDLDVISSSIPWASVNANLYTFELGDIAMNESGSFSVVVIPNCQNTSLGDILCMEAHIYPDSVPDINGLNWNGALITVDGECIDGELMFHIKNIGLGNMITPNNYIVIEDAILNATNSFQLNSGTQETVSIQGNGASFWLRAEQVSGAPSDPFPGYAIEGCATDTVMEFSTGFMNNFAYSDLGQAEDTECRQVVGSFDPNQKLAFPDGFLEANYIERDVPIEYMIEFQNTGTDTAFLVEVVDMLSEDLDINSFEVVGSSHTYSYRILPNKELTFRFDQILLPDSTTNEAASHGYVKFKISPKTNLPAETIIENQAAIYFDFNDPIITNQVFHTIWEENIFDFFTESTYLEGTGISMNIFPNPFSQSATVLLNGKVDGTFHFVLYDIFGKVIYEKKNQHSQFEIQPKGLAAGAYFFSLFNDEQIIGNGKLIVK